MRNAFAVMYCPYSDGAGSQTCPLKIKQQTYTHTDTGWNAKTHRKPNRHIVCASRRRCDTLIIISSAGGWRESSEERASGGTARSLPLFDSSARAIFF